MTIAPNTLRWRPDDRRGHVESHFIKANAPDGDRALWIKHTIFAPADAPESATADVWAIAFDRTRPERFPLGVKTSVPAREAIYETAPFRIRTGDATMGVPERNGEATVQGKGHYADHHLRWSLAFAPVGPAYRPFPLEALYRAPVPRTKSITACPDAAFRGSAEVDGETWSIDGWRGMQSHNWGREHAHAYVWAHCNVWEDGREGTWLEAMSGRVKLGRVVTPWLSVGALHVDGQTWRFDGPRAMVARRVEVSPHRWRFRLVRRDATLEGELSAEPNEMAGLYYENPAGPTTHCLNSKLAHGRIRLRRTGGPDLELRSEAAALEVGTREAGHGVRMIL